MMNAIHAPSTTRLAGSQRRPSGSSANRSTSTTSTIAHGKSATTRALGPAPRARASPTRATSGSRRTTSAVLVVSPAGIDAATQSRSTPNGEQLLPHWGSAPSPCVQEVPWSTDFQTSACSGATPSLPARLHR